MADVRELNSRLDELWDFEEDKLLNSKGASPINTSTIFVLEFKECCSYQIPSFSVLTVSLRHAVVQMYDDSQELELGIFDIFFQDDKSIMLPTPCCVEAIATCFVNVNEFAQQIVIENLRLVINAIFVVWNWNIASQIQKTSALEAAHDTDEEELHEEESENDVNSSEAESAESLNTVTFKCIGATRDVQYQKILRIACERIRNGYTVPVRITPEPDNIYDSKAIAFECKLDEKWERIGYIIKELLDIVHASIECKEIKKVEFSWIKFITDWRQSGPGYFAGIAISKNGNWDKKVLKCSSTR